MYFTGVKPPVHYPAVPFSAIIDMRTGKLALKDGTVPIPVNTILFYAQHLDD